MPITLGNKTLNCTRIAETFELVGSQWDGWENGQYKRKIFTVGLIRKWTLECIEKDVAWADSAVPYLQQKAVAAEALTFSISDGNRYQVSTNVYVLNIQLTLKPTGTKNIRYFTIQLREA
ncbi:MAG: hypothetical protein QW660_04615 [Candidatus Bathyarchaeia archaeon]